MYSKIYANKFGFIQTATDEALACVASGEVDLNNVATNEVLGLPGYDMNDFGFIQIAHKSVLEQACRGEIDLNNVAKKEIKERGLTL